MQTGARFLGLALPTIVLVHVAAGFAPAMAQAIEVPYRGLEYAMLSRDGVTVMIAPLDLTLLHYSAAHVWITNGSRRALPVDPQVFTATTRGAKQPQASEQRGAPDGLVVREVMERARFGDILAVVRAYERNLYGFQNPQAINYYQERKQMAMAEGGSRKVRAAAMVSALILQKGDIPPGEFREGTVFFPTHQKKAQFLSFSARLGNLSFVFPSKLAKDRTAEH